MIGENLLRPEPTLLPDDYYDVLELLETSDDPEAVAKQHPASPLAWATLADRAQREGRIIEAYAFARTGYHRGLDLLRKNGWRGQGPIPWQHEPNQAVLRALYALRQA